MLYYRWNLFIDFFWRKEVPPGWEGDSLPICCYPYTWAINFVDFNTIDGWNLSVTFFERKESDRKKRWRNRMCLLKDELTFRMKWLYSLKYDHMTQSASSWLGSFDYFDFAGRGLLIYGIMKKCSTSCEGISSGWTPDGAELTIISDINLSETAL